MSSETAGSRRALLILTAAFFATGVTALCAEVVANRLLRYVFGASHAATATVLAAYMAGLSAGAWLFGRLAARLPRKIAVYGWLELAVALCYLAMPAAYRVTSSVGLDVARAFADDPLRLGLARFAISFVFVFVPTLFMGGTLPVLVAGLRSNDAVGSALPRLYAANTLGAAAGTLLSAYALIPYFGLDRTLQFGALVNASIAAVALFVSRRSGEGSSEASSGGGLSSADAAADAATLLPAGWLSALAFAQGALVFALEVVWTHLVGTVIGVTVYAFAVMLAAILFGIGLGSALLPRLRRATRLPPAALFVLLQAGVGLAVLWTLPLWDRFPYAVYVTGWIKPLWGFADRELVRFLFALALMLPVTLLTGAALPALAAAGPPAADSSRLIGRLFGANTLGAIAGSLLAGFVLLGRLPSDTLMRGCAGAAFVLSGAALLLLRGDKRPLLRPLAGAALLALLGLAALPGWDLARLTAGSHYSWAPWSGMRYETMFFREDAQVGFVSVEKLPNKTQVMWTNGKYEGSDAPGEFQDYLAPLGAIHLRRFDAAFLLGLGPGRALGLLHAMPFQRIDVAEFSPAVVEAARACYPSFVADAFQDPRVRVVVDDGRNLLQAADQPYDLVVVAITAAAFSGTGSLYNKDFFEIARDRLRPDGVLLMWVQLHTLPEPVVRSVVHTLRSVFPELHVYAHPGSTQAYLLASMRPLVVQRAAAETLDKSAYVRRVLVEAGWSASEELAACARLTSDAELRAFLGAGPRSLYHDFYPAFEYDAARGLAEAIGGLDLERWSERRLPPFEPALSPGEAAGLRGLRLRVAGDAAGALRALEEAESQLGPSRFSPRLEELRKAAAAGQANAPRSP